MSDPKMKGAMRVKGTMRNGDKLWEKWWESAPVWSGHEDVIYTGINAQDMYIKYKYKI